MLSFLKDLAYGLAASAVYSICCGVFGSLGTDQFIIGGVCVWVVAFALASVLRMLTKYPYSIAEREDILEITEEGCRCIIRSVEVLARNHEDFIERHYYDSGRGSGGQPRLVASDGLQLFCPEPVSATEKGRTYYLYNAEHRGRGSQVSSVIERSVYDPNRSMYPYLACNPMVRDFRNLTMRVRFVDSCAPAAGSVRAVELRRSLFSTSDSYGFGKKLDLVQSGEKEWMLKVEKPLLNHKYVIEWAWE